jgi:hypothetical protein
VSIQGDTPDYQSYTSWRGTPLYGQLVTLTSATPVTIDGYVTNWASLALNINVGASVGFTITCKFYTDSTKAVICAAYTWILGGPNVGLNVVVPCMGNFVEVKFFTSEVGNCFLTATVEPMNIAVPKPIYQGTPNSVDGLGVTINAGASLTVPLPFVMEGNGELFVQCGTAGVNYNLEADALNESGAVESNLFRATTVTGAQEGTFLATAALTVMTIKNDDAANHTYSYHCQVLSQ